MYKKLLSYHRHAFTCCILFLNIFTLSRESEQNSAINFYPKIASSPPRLRLLAKSDEIIYILIKDFYSTYYYGSKNRLLNASTEELFKLIHNYLKNFEATTGQLKLKLKRQNEKTNYRALKAGWNPLTTYFMFQRFLKPLKKILVGLNTTGEAECALKKQVDLIMEISAWPTEIDLQFAINSILRIQHVYDLSTYDLSVGKIAGYETNVYLSAVDCVKIGRQALLVQNDEPYHALAVEWLVLGRRKLESNNSRLETTSGSINKAEIEYYISIAIALSQDKPFSGQCVQVDDHWYKNKKSEMNGDDPFEEAATLVRKRTSALQAWKGSTHANFNLVNYWRTCAGENYKSEYEKSKLFCWYETEVNFLFKINPLKAELLSFKPLLVIQYYDLIGNKMIEKIIQDSIARLRHSAANKGDNNRVRIVSRIRTSSSSGLMDHGKEEFFPIADIIEAVTGLKVRNSSSSEEVQTIAYTTGAHFTVHKDAIGYSTDLPSGEGDGFLDRIATFMLYLTDVEKGGGTSFPQSGIAAAPIKGSAVLWYNLLRNGATDEYTWHGGCPVIIGEKWISNKWIRSKDQMFLKDYQCVPDRTARYMIRVNGKDLMDFF